MPEDDEFSGEIRQMVVGRYRVLFTIKGRKVHVLHVGVGWNEVFGQAELASFASVGVRG